MLQDHANFKKMKYVVLMVLIINDNTPQNTYSNNIEMCNCLEHNSVWEHANSCNYS